MRINKTSFFLFTILLFALGCKENTKMNLPVEMKLNEGWRFKSIEDSNWLDAKVPGNVFVDLMNNKQIENPFWGSNEQELTWVSEKKWEYKTQFKADDKFLNNNNIDLIFEGLDTYADIYLNDTLICTANNMFLKWEIPVTQLLKNVNQLKIVFHSPINNEKHSKPSYFDFLPEKKRIFTRKAACHFGWDWAPNLPGCGIWQDVKLVAWNDAKFTDTYIQTTIEDNKASVSITYEIDSRVEKNCIINSEIEGIKSKKTKIKLSKGINKATVDFEIENPKLWWTHNLGEPHLYNLKSNLTTNNQIVDSQEKQFGIREIKLVREKDSVGSSFYFMLNGEAVYMNGANYIPQDAFVSQVTDEKYETLLKSVIDANMNMLRVWGGGIYEKEKFYDLCNQYGILIWQDFMFANAMYYADQKFIQNIENEATYQVKRLRNHPCMAIWCGNNEIDEAWHNWGWSTPFNDTDSAEVREDYLELFEKILPETVKKFHSDIAYTSSSPTFGRGNKRSLYEGDAHYWGVWHDGYDFSMFEKTTGRFMSEYGFQSFPEIKTLKTVIPENEMFATSATMTNHQKHPRGNKLIKQYMADYYNIPDDFENFVYVSQLLQAEGIRQGIEAHKKAKLYCMGTLYWQLNDCWPVVSWSAIDYYGRKKALYYFSKESFKNIIASHSFDNQNLNIHLINDSLKSLNANINIQLMDFGGKTLWGNKLNYNIKKNSSEIVFKKDINEWLAQYDSSSIVLRIRIEQENKTIEDKLVYFCKPKNMKLNIPEINYKLDKNEEGYRLKIKTNTLAKNVYIKLPVEAELSDNYFDLLPNIEKTIVIQTKSEIENLEILTLNHSK